LKYFLFIGQHVLPNRIAGGQYVRHGGIIKEIQMMLFGPRRGQILVEKYSTSPAPSRQGRDMKFCPYGTITGWGLHFSTNIQCLRH